MGARSIYRAACHSHRFRLQSVFQADTNGVVGEMMTQLDKTNARLSKGFSLDRVTFRSVALIVPSALIFHGDYRAPATVNHQKVRTLRLNHSVAIVGRTFQDNAKSNLREYVPSKLQRLYLVLSDPVDLEFASLHNSLSSVGRLRHHFEICQEGRRNI